MNFVLCAIVLVASVALGGATRGGFLSDVILQVIAIPAVLAALWTGWTTPLAKRARIALAFCAAVVVIPLVQLIPLPPWAWTALPKRDVVAAGFDLIAAPRPWMPISLAPAATWLSALSLLAPLAVFCGTVLLDRRQRRALSLVVIAAATASVFVGLAQVAQGESDAIGFFANRNHFAALLYAAILFAAAWAISAAIIAGPKARDYDVVAMAVLIGAFTVLVVLLSGQLMARSRAGLGLTMIALFGVFALAASDRRALSGVSPVKLLVAAISLAVVFAAQYALFRALERFEADPLEDARIVFARNTLAAAWAYMPFGSGVGSFVPVYGQFEKPVDALANTFANRAHNDFLELWLETGLVGLVLIGAFMLWFLRRSWAAWRQTNAGALGVDVLLTRAATIVIALLLAHSLVDYPLRTGAIMAIMAFACALLVDPPLGQRRADWADAQVEEPVTRRRRVRSAPAPASASAAPIADISPAATAAPSPAHAERWGAAIEWPEAWRKPAKASPRPLNDPPAPPPPKGD